MTHDIHDLWPVLGSVLQHQLDQTLEAIRKVALRFVLSMDHPEIVVLVRDQEVKDLVVGRCDGERWMASVHSEENNAEGKQIDHVAMV